MTELNNMINTCCEALSDKKGFDIKILDVTKLSTICDDFIIASGSNKSQLDALCDCVEEAMGRAGYIMRNREGQSASGWILLDYYDIVVHIFSDEMREFYNIEHTWRDAVSRDFEK
jgi:ribosome-associated protein